MTIFALIKIMSFVLHLHMIYRDVQMVAIMEIVVAPKIGAKNFVPIMLSVENSLFAFLSMILMKDVLKITMMKKRCFKQNVILLR